jgi:hypothetical protein
MLQKRALLTALITAALSPLVQAAPPSLPSGISTGAPTMPSGLGAAPALPSGLAIEDVSNNDFSELGDEATPLSISGFWEARGGLRTQSDSHQRGTSIGETRLQIETQKEFAFFTANLTTDLLYDTVDRQRHIDLEQGKGWLDIREANIEFSPADSIDIKLGRQILTWGTGDLLFINDMFSKDWNSFFIGRDEEYLKAPSDAIKASLFSSTANIDLVITPHFDADRYIDGRRVSFFNPMLGEISGQNAIVHTDQPHGSEVALRIYQTVGAYELAFYGYDGFWKSPAGFDATTGLSTFPELRVYGASVRGPLSKGIANIEIGYYDSKEDSSGDDPFINNSEFHFLAGYEQELVKDLTIGVQYYLEWLMDYNEYRDTLPTGSRHRDEYRHLLTTRLTWLTLNQNLQWSLFAYYSPSDGDGYLRPKVHYKIDDHWSAEAGGNFFFGERTHTFFSQFRHNNNLFAAIRYGF